MSASSGNNRKISEDDNNQVSGTLISEKEKIYLGEYHGRRTYDGQRHGYAWSILPNSDIYVGNYESGMRHGKGLYVFKDGSRYNGGWRNNNKDGMGKMIYPDGSYYEGEWRHNTRYGFGTYYYLNGDTYKGSWKEGKWDGLGVYTFSHLDVSLKCLWFNGVQNGAGKISYPCFTFYSSWMEGVGEGKGLYTFFSKCIQEGINLINRDESQKTINSIMNHSSNINSLVQYMEPEDGVINQVEGSLEDDTDYTRVLTSSETGGELTNKHISVAWIPLRIYMYNINMIPPEPTYHSQESVSLSEVLAATPEQLSKVRSIQNSHLNETELSVNEKEENFI